MHGTAEDKAGIRPGLPRSSWCRSDQLLTCGNATRKFINSCRFYPVTPAARAFAGVLLLWPGTDVLLDPGDDHDGDCVTRDSCPRRCPPRHCALAQGWVRLGPPTLNSRQSAETTPTATPRHPSVLSPLLRCPCSPGPEPVTPSSSTGSTSPSDICFQSRQLCACRALNTRSLQNLAAATRSGTAGHGRSGGGQAGPLARVPGAVPRPGSP
jgi:hypothetical protein